MVVAMARVFVSRRASYPVDRTGTGKLAYIDVLRGIAILGVIAVHHGFEFKLAGALSQPSFYGRLGVQLFFVASAMTLCRSAVQRAGEPRAVTSFLLRRYVRIAPLYYLGLGLYALMRLVLPPELTFYERGLYGFGNVAANLLFVHGFMPDAYNRVVPGGWSIGVEMTFYLAFPVLFAGTAWLVCAGNVRALVAASAGGWVICVAAQLLLGRWLTLPLDDPFVYSSIANQLPVFLVGIVGYYAVDQGRAEALPNARAWFVLLTIAVSCMQLWPFPGSDQIVPTLAGVSFIFLASMVREQVEHGGWLGLVGQRSYSMYILHFLPVWLVGLLVERAAATSPAMQMLLYMPTLLIAAAATFVAAGWTERWIERPAIGLGRRWIARRARDTGRRLQPARASV